MDERSRIQTLFIAVTVLPASAYRNATAGRTERFCVVESWEGFGGWKLGGGESAILRRSTFM
jgi:hypothetical protein